MRIALFGSAALLALALAVHAQSADKNLTIDDYRQMTDDIAYWDTQRHRYWDIEARALARYPGRRDTPLRELNISDEEVREVETIAYQYLPRTVINISPVVTDCPCEEGPACTAQVYVVSTVKDKSRGLQLSRMHNRWQLGVVQEWWLRFESIGQPNTGNSYRDYYLRRKAKSELLEEFPVCAKRPAPRQISADSTRAEAKQ